MVEVIARLVDALEVADHVGLAGLDGFFLAQFAVPDDGVERGEHFLPHAEQVDLAGFNLPGREGVVEERQQLSARGVNLLDVAQQPFRADILDRLQQHLAVADDLVERGAQGVAELGQRLDVV